MFDVFHLLRNVANRFNEKDTIKKPLKDFIIMEVERENEFAPVKNATGVDSPETASELYRKKQERLKAEGRE